MDSSSDGQQTIRDTKNGNDSASGQSVEKCRQWLNSCSLSDDNDSSEFDDGKSVSTEISESTAVSDECYLEQTKEDCVEIMGLPDNSEIISDINLSKLLGKQPNNFENIQIYKSKNVHVGDVTQVNGPIYINQFVPILNQKIEIYNEPQKNQTHNNIAYWVVPRKIWLAQPPNCEEDIVYLEEPVKYIIISHSATEEADTQTENNLIVRLIQQFHIESRHWNDIGYNFLIGAEGSVYEGRGWGVMGAHTVGYNKFTLGICFIGTFTNKKPTERALQMAKALINAGIQMGKISEDYKVLGHCQCTSTESPGKTFFADIQTWGQWDGSVSLENPLPKALPF